MTSSNAQRNTDNNGHNSKMASNAQPRFGFPNLSTPNNDRRTPWQQTQQIWGTTVGTIGKPPKNTSGQQSRESNDDFLNGTTGSSALALTSEPEVRQPDLWNMPMQQRNTSGNSSPSRSRTDNDSITNSHLYGSPSMNPIQPSAIGQRPSGRKPGMDATRDEFTLGLNTLALSSDPKPNGFSMTKQRSQDQGYMNAMQQAVNSRDASGPASRNSETNSHAQGPSFSDFTGYGAGNGMGSMHVSMHVHRGSQASPYFQEQQAVTSRIPNGRDGFHDFLSTPNGLADNGYGGMPYQQLQQQSSFNAGVLPWGNNSEGYQNTGIHDGRMHAAERNSPAGQMYNGWNSPKNSVGTPQPGVDAWSRPSSRDLRQTGVSGFDRRGSGQQIMPHTLHQQQQGQFFGQQQYFHNAYPQLPQFPHGFEGHQSAYRQTGPYGYPANQLTGHHGNQAKSSNHEMRKEMSSQVLQNFKANKANKYTELRELYGHICEFAGDQYGSRHIQTKLETANSDEKARVFEEVLPNALQLMRDIYGNYVIQKIFEHGDQIQKKALANKMRNNIYDLSKQMYSCRVVQKALEFVFVDTQAEFVRELEPHICEMVKEQNGNHVIQKIIQVVPREHIGFVYDSFKGRVIDLAEHSYGCRVIQRALENGTESDITALMEEIHKGIGTLVVNQYGNYVAQHVMESGLPEHRSKIIRVVLENFVQYSKHKFASNVVEMCMEHGTLDEVRLFKEKFRTLIGETQQSIMKDQFGNYVIQKLLRTLPEGPERREFIEEVRPQLNHLKRTTQGRQTSGIERPQARQIAAIERLLQATCPDVSASVPLSNGSTAHSGIHTPSSGPASPGLPQRTSTNGSEVPTPNLVKSDPNSPSTNSAPPSTNSSVRGGRTTPIEKRDAFVKYNPAVDPTLHRSASFKRMEELRKQINMTQREGCEWDLPDDI